MFEIGWGCVECSIKLEVGFVDLVDVDDLVDFVKCFDWLADHCEGKRTIRKVSGYPAKTLRMVVRPSLWLT